MKILIRETLERVIEAESIVEAADRYAAGEIVLTADDFTGFEIIEEKSEEDDNNADIQQP